MTERYATIITYSPGGAEAVEHISQTETLKNMYKEPSGEQVKGLKAQRRPHGLMSELTAVNLVGGPGVLNLVTVSGYEIKPEEPCAPAVASACRVTRVHRY
jgi:hypothetical protein